MTAYKKESAAPWRIGAREWLFFAAVVLAWGAIAATLGKETGWDFRNYHWYNAFAFLNGRMGFDLGVAHHATYYNPLLDVPFYALAQIHPAAALFFLGAAQGLNIVPLYLIARAGLARDTRMGGAILALLCVTGSTAVSLTGTTSYDAVLSVPVFFALALLVMQERVSLGVVAIAGLLVGSAAGLKLVDAIYAAGFAAVLLVMPGSMKERALRLGAGALGGFVGAALFGGFWAATLWRETGNPVFPYFNELFASPLALDASYRDTRFLPAGLWDALVYPFRFSFNYAIADDTPFQNLRVLAAYIALPAAAVLWAAGTRAADAIIRPHAARILFAFAAASYVAWIAVFAIYRYIVPLEMLAPLVIVAAIGLVPVSLKARLAAAAMVLAATAVFAHYGFGPRAAADDPHVQVKGISFPHPERSMLLLAGYEPFGFIVPSLPPEVPVLRIDGYLAGPDDGSGLTNAMQARVRAHRGRFFLLAAPQEMERAGAAVSAYGLALAPGECGNAVTNLGGPYLFCPLVRHD
ncbi:MAG: hypothetical protein ACT4OG_08490 [Alphaproteobacteria bacterium]